MTPEELRARCRKIKLFATDVDGVLTDGGLYYTEDGNEIKKFNIRDGGAFVLLRNAGIRCAIITGEQVHLVERRAQKLEIDIVRLGVRDKRQCITEIVNALDMQPDKVAYVGDDINDLPLASLVGLFFSVRDACFPLEKFSHHRLSRRGGEGAVREAAEIILRNAGTYSEALRSYYARMRSMTKAEVEAILAKMEDDHVGCREKGSPPSARDDRV